MGRLNSNFLNISSSDIIYFTYRLGNNFDRVDSVALGCSVTGSAVVVAVVPKALLLRNAPNRLGRLVVTAAAVGASVGGKIGIITLTEFQVLNSKTCGRCCRRSGGGRGSACTGAETAVSGGKSPSRTAAGPNRCAVPSSIKNNV